MPQIEARFQKNDLYDHPVYICSAKTESEGYQKLKKYAAKLQAARYETFLPVYHNGEFEYATIRFKSLPQYIRAEKNDTYLISFTVKTQTRDDKTYVNAFVDRMKLVKKADKVDEGEVLDLE